MSHETPFPHPLEAVRRAAKAFDTRNCNPGSAKKLDELLRKGHVWKHQVEMLAEELVIKPLVVAIGEGYGRATGSQQNSAPMFTSVAKILRIFLVQALDRYAEIVISVAADGITRDELLRCGLLGLFGAEVAQLSEQLEQKVVPGISLLNLVSSEGSAVGVVLAHFDSTSEMWRDYVRNLPKEHSLRSQRWRRGETLPSLSNIRGLGGRGAPWLPYKLLLILARAIDEFARESGGELLSLVAREHRKLDDFAKRVLSLQEQVFSERDNLRSVLSIIQHGLSLPCGHGDSDREMLRIALDGARASLQSTARSSRSLYWLDWHEARWQVLSGELKQAAVWYRTALKGALFSAGEHQEAIITEAFSVSAVTEPPDKILMKRAKAAGLMLHLSGTTGPSKLKSADVESLEGWEFASYAAYFSELFPKERFFPGHQVLVDYGRSLVDPNNPSAWFPALKADFKRPNRRVSDLRVSGQRCPQLIALLYRERFADVERLLLAGVDVNAIASNGETVLHAALWPMDCTNSYEPSRDRRFFDLIIDRGVDRATINKQADAVLHTPLGLAIDSGEPSIVSALLAAGADPDIPCKNDGQTPLMTAVHRLAELVNPRSIVVHQSRQLAHSIKAYTGGRLGPGVNDQFASFGQDSAFLSEEHERLTARRKVFLSADKLRVVILNLLKHGASSNIGCETSQIAGCTPMMLLAELDEAYLYRQMFEVGGDPFVTGRVSGSGVLVTGKDLATLHRSTRVLQVMSELGV
ncbi:MAG: hypothetical protein KBT72_07395 [Zhongshania sp.]|jgi:hypothetical protein|nr:hypothetical protein [Zhongshania sp.]